MNQRQPAHWLHPDTSGGCWSNAYPSKVNCRRYSSTDLGSGDGRIVIAAAQQFGTRGVGLEIDPLLVQEANENAQRLQLNSRVEFRQQDLFESDFSEATVVTLYLMPHLNIRLRPKLFHQLKPGTRVVSHDFKMGNWKPDQVVQTQTLEEATLYYWVIPG